MLNPTFPPSTGSGGGTDPELENRVSSLETETFSLGNRIWDLENQRTEAWIFEDLRVDSTVFFETTVDLPPFVGDLTGLTIEVLATNGSYLHTFETTPLSLTDLVAEVSETIAPSGITFEITGSDPQNGLMFGLVSSGENVGFSIEGTALPNLGFTAGYYANEQILRHFSSATDGIYDFDSGRQLSVVIAAMKAEIEALKAQVAALGGA